MNEILPGIVVTGASGFIGRHFVIAVSGKYRLFCIARRSQKEVGIPYHDNIHWLQVDVTNRESLMNVFSYIKDHGGADYVLHLAGYYDFTYKENPAYEKINVAGTRNVLDMSKSLGIKRFIFSSSLAACNFPPKGKALTEESPLDADFPYGRCKRKEETIITEYSKVFPCSIVRLAAVYSDWCEYPMLYMLLRYWLSENKLMSRILIGSGESALPYIHIRDLIKAFLQIMKISDTLPPLTTFIASPQGSVSQNELFNTATRYYYWHEIKPFRVPKLLAFIGLIAISLLGRLSGKETLEQPWMTKYVDKKLTVDASATYNALGWKPTPRYHILRRLLFLTEKMTGHPNNWTFRNEVIIRKVAFRKSILIYDILAQLRESLVEKIAAEVMHPKNEHRFPNYRKMYGELLKWYITLNYQLVAAAVRSRDRSIIPVYAQVIAYKRYMEGFEANEVKNLMLLIGRTMKEYLLSRPELKNSNRQVEDYVILTSQLTADEFEDAYEIFEEQSPEQQPPANVAQLTSIENLKRILRRLEDVYSDAFSNQLKKEAAFDDDTFFVTLDRQDGRA
ncbi:MAG: NAD(P)-dependent oxidoreductase [Desulfobacterales bacterium]|jgi:nucleoside-diphosphate-sugar epimerase